MMLDTLCRHDIEALPFTQEIVSTLNSMDGDKALGLKGFIVVFWQTWLEFVKLEVMSFFKEFYEFSSLERSLDATFLVMIPKKGRAKELKDFLAY